MRMNTLLYCIKTLTKAINACVQYVFGLRRRDDITGLYTRILGCKIIDYLKR